jgi:hypothetical protein
MNLAGKRSLRELVRDHEKVHRPGAESERRFFASLSIGKAIEHAARATNGDRKRFDHQRRIKRTAIASALQVLSGAVPLLVACKSFDELHATVERLVGDIYGIGELYIYDTALRIGARLRLFPDRIYLHAGTREGARNLGLNVSRKTLARSELPEVLQSLSASELEDFLCIYKAEFNS